MTRELVNGLPESFESHAHQARSGLGGWLARTLQHLLGYNKGDSFLSAGSRAKTACGVSGPNVKGHLSGVDVNLGFACQHEVGDPSLINFTFRRESDDGSPSTSSIAIY